MVELRQHQDEISVRTEGRGLIEITALIERVVRDSRMDCGLCTVLVCHTSASLVVQENADPSARRDLEEFLERIAPEHDPTYTHTSEGPDDMPSHLRAALTSTSESIPIRGGRLALGTWQGLFLCEHRRRAHRRSLVVHVLGA